MIVARIAIALKILAKIQGAQYPTSANLEIIVHLDDKLKAWLDSVR